MGKTSVELLIFDLDGTLIESKWDIAASVNLTLAEMGLPELTTGGNLRVCGRRSETTVTPVGRRE